MAFYQVPERAKAPTHLCREKFIASLFSCFYGKDQYKNPLLHPYCLQLIYSNHLLMILFFSLLKYILIFLRMPQNSREVFPALHSTLYQIYVPLVLSAI